MSNHACHSRAGGRAALALAGVGLLLAAAPAAHAETTWTANLGAAEGWTDNIDLAPPGFTNDAEITELLPGLSLKHDSQYLHATLSDAFAAYFYGGSQHGHDLYNSGNLFGDAAVVPDWLFLDGGAQQSQSVVNPANVANVGLLFPTGNLADDTTASIGPAIRHQFSWVKLEANYSWGFMHNKAIGSVDEPLPNSRTQTGNFKLSSPDQTALLTWDALYQRQETSYTNLVAPRYLYEIAQADLGWLVAHSVRLLAEGGSESNVANNVSAGGLVSPFWLGGFDWSPDRLNDLKAMAGHRFFGKTYQASARHQSRLLNLQVTYSEAPTTNTGGFLPQPPPQSLVNIPGTPLFDRLTTDAYLLKALDARAGLTGRLTELGLELTSTEQRYFTVAGAAPTGADDDQMRAGTLYLTRRMGMQLQGALTATLDHTDLRGVTTTTYNTRIFSARLTDQLGLRSTLTLAASRYAAYGAQRYNADLVTLTFNMMFGNGATGNGFAPMAPPMPAPAPIAQGGSPVLVPVAPPAPGP